MKNNTLHNRMKSYEESYKYLITPKTYIIVRCDGKNFSKYTSKLVKPFDDELADAMYETAIALCKEFNAKFAYTQSDEISLVITDIGDNPDTQPILGNVLQKLCSLTASVATAKFNEVRNLQYINSLIDDIKSFGKVTNVVLPKQAYFDARVFVVPNADEVINHMIWRQQDATRNSVSMAAHALLGHNATMNLSGEEKQEKMFQDKDVNWNDYPTKYKRGVVISKKTILKDVINPTDMDCNSEPEVLSVTRSKWMVDFEIPIFTKDKQYLFDLIPIK